MSSRNRSSKALARRTAELAFAVPQVIAHRALRAPDLKEYHLMGAEKIAAFNESWNAMVMQSFWESQKLAFSLGMSLWAPWLADRQSASKQLASAARNIADAGLAPVHRRARANARRLRRARR